jgi:hypothetical protein
MRRKRYKITIEISPDEGVTLQMMEAVLRRTFVDRPQAVYPANARFKIEDITGEEQNVRRQRTDG